MSNSVYTTTVNLTTNSSVSTGNFISSLSATQGNNSINFTFPTNGESVVGSNGLIDNENNRWVLSEDYTNNAILFQACNSISGAVQFVNNTNSGTLDGIIVQMSNQNYSYYYNCFIQSTGTNSVKVYTNIIPTTSSELTNGQYTNGVEFNSNPPIYYDIVFDSVNSWNLSPVNLPIDSLSQPNGSSIIKNTEYYSGNNIDITNIFTINQLLINSSQTNYTQPIYSTILALIGIAYSGLIVSPYNAEYINDNVEFYNNQATNIFMNSIALFVVNP